MDYSTAFTNGTPGNHAGGIAGFDTAEAAPEFAPVPPGIYAALAERGEFTTTRSGAEAYRLRFRITDGPQAGKSVVRTWTFGPKALAYTKRDLAPFGLTTTAQLLAPFPEAGRTYRVRLVVALQRGDDGIERNDIKRIEQLGIDTHPATAFALSPLPGAGEGGNAK